MEKELRVIIPAAGKGTRLLVDGIDIPKVMRVCAGKPLLESVLKSVDFIEPKDTFIVVGYKKEQVIDYFGDKYNYVEQKEQLGTGHAVMVCEPYFRDFDGSVLVAFGDMPLFKPEDMKKMCEQHEKNGADCTLMTAENPDLKLWARIVRDSKGDFAAIVEGKDCNEEQAKIKELFSGIIIFNGKSLFEMLPLISTNNVQHEYYLTEIPELMVKHNMKVETFAIDDGDCLRGVNTPEDFKICESILKGR